MLGVTKVRINIDGYNGFSDAESSEDSSHHTVNKQEKIQPNKKQLESSNELFSSDPFKLFISWAYILILKFNKIPNEKDHVMLLRSFQILGGEERSYSTSRVSSFWH